MTLNFWFYLLSDGVSGMHHPAQFIQGQSLEPGLCLCDALCQLSYISISDCNFMQKEQQWVSFFKDHLNL